MLYKVRRQVLVSGTILLIAIVFLLTLSWKSVTALTVASAQVVSSRWDNQAGVIFSDQTHNGRGYRSLLSDDGRYVAFQSTTPDVVANDTNGLQDIFLRDTTNSTTERISVSTSGAEANGRSVLMDITENGRYVVFMSRATNLHDGQVFQGSGNSIVSYAYLRDTQLNTTEMIAWAPNGDPIMDTYTTFYSGHAYPLSISNDGRLVLFALNKGNVIDGLQANMHGNNINTYALLDRSTNSWRHVPAASTGGFIRVDDNFDYTPQRMSCDGSLVILPGTNTFSVYDVRANEHVYQVPAVQGLVVRIGTASISCAGRYIAYVTSNLSMASPNDPHPAEQVVVYDRLTGESEYVGKDDTGSYLVSDKTVNYRGIAIADDKSVLMHVGYAGTVNGFPGTVLRYVVKDGADGSIFMPNRQATDVQYAFYGISSDGSQVLINDDASAFPVSGNLNTGRRALLLDF